MTRRTLLAVSAAPLAGLLPLRTAVSDLTLLAGADAIVTLTIVGNFPTGAGLRLVGEDGIRRPIGYLPADRQRQAFTVRVPCTDLERLDIITEAEGFEFQYS